MCAIVLRVGWPGAAFPSGPEDASQMIMKTTQLEKYVRNGRVTGVPRQAQPGLPNGQALLSPPRTDRSRIQWPTEQQMQDVSKHLVRIGRVGKRSELAGDYFKSGDLAYQVQEIIRLTGELLKKSQRTKT